MNLAMLLVAFLCRKHLFLPRGYHCSRLVKLGTGKDEGTFLDAHVVFPIGWNLCEELRARFSACLSVLVAKFERCLLYTSDAADE